jgi:hypothetical protein
MNKMTKWFPSKTKPVRDGVYEVFTPNSIVNRYAYFDRKGWRLCAFDMGTAADEIGTPDQAKESSMNLPGSKWRGFTEEQK